MLLDPGSNIHHFLHVAFSCCCFGLEYSLPTLPHLCLSFGWLPIYPSSWSLNVTCSRKPLLTSLHWLRFPYYVLPCYSTHPIACKLHQGKDHVSKHILSTYSVPGSVVGGPTKDEWNSGLTSKFAENNGVRDVRLTGVMKIEKKIIYLFMEGTVEGRICGSMNLWKYEFIEASPGMVEGSFQLGL